MKRPSKKLTLVACALVLATTGAATSSALFSDTSAVAANSIDSKYALASTVPTGSYGGILKRGGGYLWSGTENTVSPASLERFDPATGALTAISLGAGTYAYGTSISPDGSHIYVASWGSGTILRVNVATQSVDATWTASNPFDVAATPDGSTVWASGGSCSCVQWLRTSDGATMGSLNVGFETHLLAMNADGSRVLVTDLHAGYAALIQATGAGAPSVIRTYSGYGSATAGVAFNPAGTVGYFSTPSGVVAIDALTGNIIATVPIIGGPSVGLTFTPDGGRLLAIGGTTLYVIDPQTFGVVQIVPGLNNPYGLASTADSHSAWTIAGPNQALQKVTW